MCVCVLERVCVPLIGNFFKQAYILVSESDCISDTEKNIFHAIMYCNFTVLSLKLSKVNVESDTTQCTNPMCPNMIPSEEGLNVQEGNEGRVLIYGLTGTCYV